MTITLDVSKPVFFSVKFLLFFIGAVIKSSIQALIINWLARYTPIGKIALTRNTDDAEIFD